MTNVSSRYSTEEIHALMNNVPVVISDVDGTLLEGYALIYGGMAAIGLEFRKSPLTAIRRYGRAVYALLDRHKHSIEDLCCAYGRIMSGMDAGLFEKGSICLQDHIFPSAAQFILRARHVGKCTALVSLGDRRYAESIGRISGVEHVRSRELCSSGGLLTGSWNMPLYDARLAKKEWCMELSKKSPYIYIANDADDIDALSLAILRIGINPSAELVSTNLLDIIAIGNAGWTELCELLP